jgi:hypothetical protein
MRIRHVGDVSGPLVSYALLAGYRGCYLARDQQASKTDDDEACHHNADNRPRVAPCAPTSGLPAASVLSHRSTSRHTFRS